MIAELLFFCCFFLKKSLQLDTYMDEKFITRAFATMGEQVINVRIIRNKMTG